MITPVQKNKSKGILTWYACVTDPKKKNKSGESVRHFFSLGTTSKSEAKRIILERIKDGSFDIKEESETITLRECAVKFEQYERSKGAKSGSIETMYQAINMLKTLFDRRISDIKTQDIAEAFQSQSEGLAPITYRNRKIILSTFFRYIVDTLELYPKNPIAKAIPRRKVPKKIKRLLDDGPDRQNHRRGTYSKSKVTMVVYGFCRTPKVRSRIDAARQHLQQQNTPGRQRRQGSDNSYLSTIRP